MKLTASFIGNLYDCAFVSKAPGPRVDDSPTFMTLARVKRYRDSRPLDRGIARERGARRTRGADFAVNLSTLD